MRVSRALVLNFWFLLGDTGFDIGSGLASAASFLEKDRRFKIKAASELQTKLGGVASSGLGNAIAVEAVLAPAPAPSPLLATWPVLPLCNWTVDAEGVARPVICVMKSVRKDVEDALDVFVTTNEWHPSDSGHVTCKVKPGGVFSIADGCAPPPLSNCPMMPPPPAVMEVGGASLLRVQGFGQTHGATRTISCVEGAAPIDGRYSLDSWNEKWYTGTTSFVSTCNNGTWSHVEPFTAVLRPSSFTCASAEQIELVKKLVYYLEWANSSYVETEARGSEILWLDIGALERRTALAQALKTARHLYDSSMARQVASPRVLHDATNDLIGNFIGPPRGVRRSPQVCQDFERHFRWVDQLVDTRPFVCRFVVQKTPRGIDPISHNPTYTYRDGCYCESNWIGLCPFKAGQSPTYKDFGFHTLEQSPLSDKIGGAATGALCWYWSDAIHPEYGYSRPSTESQISAQTISA